MVELGAPGHPPTLTVPRCPDRDTADRVMSALKSRPSGSTTPWSPSTEEADRRRVRKLKAQGIIVQGEADDAAATRPKSRKKRKIVVVPRSGPVARRAGGVGRLPRARPIGRDRIDSGIGL